MEHDLSKRGPVETVYSLAYALDSLDYSDISRHFEAEIPFRFDITALLETPPKDVTPAEYYQMARHGLGGFTATQHILGNPLVTFDSPRVAHVKVYVSAYHGLTVDDVVEGVTTRVFWFIDLEEKNEQWFIRRWAIKKAAPIDFPLVFEKGHKRAKSGQMRGSSV